MLGAMRRLLVFVLGAAVGVFVAASLFDGIDLSGSSTGQHWVTALVAGLILGAINAFVRPVVQIIALPVTLVTLGLFYLVVNALMFELAAAVAGHTDYVLHVAGFGSALLGAITVSILTWAVGLVLRDDRG